jgi:hypothetical protein
MTHGWFIAGAYAVALIGTLGLTGWSFIAMRRAEQAADALKGDK